MVLHPKSNILSKRATAMSASCSKSTAVLLNAVAVEERVQYFSTKCNRVEIWSRRNLKEKLKTFCRCAALIPQEVHKKRNKGLQCSQQIPTKARFKYFILWDLIYVGNIIWLLFYVWQSFEMQLDNIKTFTSDRMNELDVSNARKGLKIMSISKGWFCCIMLIELMRDSASTIHFRARLEDRRWVRWGAPGLTPGAALGRGEHQDYRSSTSLSFRRSAPLSRQAGYRVWARAQGRDLSREQGLLFCSTWALKRDVCFQKKGSRR